MLALVVSVPAVEAELAADALWALGVVAVGWGLLQELIPTGDERLPGLPGLPVGWLAAVPWWMVLLVLALLVGLGLGYWGWWTTWFVIDEHEVRVENRGAFAESRRIAFASRSSSHRPCSSAVARSKVDRSARASASRSRRRAASTSTGPKDAAWPSSADRPTWRKG